MIFPKRKNHFTNYEMLGPRGWTDDLIANILRGPDIVISFPRDTAKEPQRFFERDRVLEAEQDQAVADIITPRADAYEEEKRYRQACKSDRRMIIKSAIARDDIVVERLPINTLRIRALETFYERNAASGRPAPDKLDEPTLRKIYLNFAVGQLVDYDAINAKLPEPLAKADLHRLISADITAQIFAAYPDLSEPA